MKSSLFALSSLFVAVLATPTPTLNKRQSQTQCGSLGNNQYSTMTATPYELQSDLWGADSSGSQCWTLDSGSSSGISWSTSWTWGGGSDSVKSYTHVALDFSPVPISHIHSIPSTWTWTYTANNNNNNLKADVAYDMFTDAQATPPNGLTHDYEIMVWLADLGGAHPIGYGDGAKGSIAVGGVPFTLYAGLNDATGYYVFSFVADSPQETWSGDLLNFHTYLAQQSLHGFGSAQYLTDLQAGTEAFTGSGATFATTQYAAAVYTL